MPVPGLLLTGGSSRRMGTPKATLVLGADALADRAARLLSRVCDPAVEVGPGYSPLPRVDEHPAGRGPLAALVAGFDAVGTSGPVLLLACDLPFVSEALLARLAAWPGSGTVVPVDPGGAVQPVCARYGRDALDRARARLDAGERSLRSVLSGPDVTVLDDVDPRELVDVDSPEDAAQWGIRRPGSLDP